MRTRTITSFVAALLFLAGCATNQTQAVRSWTPDQIQKIQALALSNLPQLPPDPTNKYGDDPRAAELGKQLFSDMRFSANGAVSCATCHQSALHFNDNKPLAQGVGKTNRKAMTVIGTAYSPWFFWDGRKDSQWAQALGPLESVVEHGGTRMQYARLISAAYREPYEALFGPLPDLSDTKRFPERAAPIDDAEARAAWGAMTPQDREAVTRIYVNMGKAIAAFERTLLPQPSRFDDYAAALTKQDTTAMRAAFTPTEEAGLELFIGKADCTKCHNTPLFTNNDFHNTGVPAVPGLPRDTGRLDGSLQVQQDEFNCLSPYSDAPAEACGELKFMRAGEIEQLRAFKPPTLRGVAETAPYMHAGQYKTLREVLEHYSRAPAAPEGKTELEPLNLTEQEKIALEAFLRALSPNP